MWDMAEVNVHEAKTHLSRLLLRVAGGEEIVIAKAGKPVARLVPIEPKTQSLVRTMGSSKYPMILTHLCRTRCWPFFRLENPPRHALLAVDAGPRERAPPTQRPKGQRT
jgi:prevent-host-death family protein